MTSIATSLLILSDTHSYSTRFRDLSASFLAYPSADVVIHCGDLSTLGEPEEYQHALSMLTGLSAELKIVIAGNHDLSLDPEYCKKPMRGVSLDQDAHAKAKAFWGDYARSRGLHYLEEGSHTFELKSGASFTIYATPFQPEFNGWAFGYPPEEDRFNLPSSKLARVYQKMKKAHPRHPVPDFRGVDIMVTHGPPAGHLDRTRRGENVGCQHLLRAVKRAKPLLHCFGHIHEGHGAERLTWSTSDDTYTTEPLLVKASETKKRGASMLDLTSAGTRAIQHGRTTAMINASILDEHSQIAHKPWLVYLDLPAKEQTRF